MVEAIQIIVMMPLFETRMPANVGIFMGELMTIAAFDIIETGEYVEHALDLEPHDPPSDKNFAQLGYESVYFFSNIGTAIFFITFIVL